MPFLSHKNTPSSPFKTISRPVTIKLGLHPPPTNPSLSSSSSPSSSRNNDNTRLINDIEALEQQYRQLESLDERTKLALLVQEQDELEREQNDIDQLLDNEEEELLSLDPETRRNRQDEALGLWMSDAELDALNQGEDDDLDNDSNSSSSIAGDEFDLYAKHFEGHDEDEEVEDNVMAEDVTEEVPKLQGQQIRNNNNAPLPSSSSSSSSSYPKSIPTEEEMLRWPIINQIMFEDRQDEVQDEYDDQA
ncbi:hypothetical protein BGZ94_004393 [Podila epigama]|nr:hypothetical protein BGZ94_004393 [Podila epigama]